MSAPNMFVEPTNDLDTDMLAAIEDLLDSWPGTLIVVSHDRYFLERVTDQQFAILPGPSGAGRLRHLPGGIDEYLKLRAAIEAQPGAVASAIAPTASVDPAAAGHATKPALSGAELRAAEKELSAVERKMERLQADVAKARDGLAALDQSDYTLLNAEMVKITAIEDEIAALEERWLELSEQLG